jgi:hypothetical protein
VGAATVNGRDLPGHVLLVFYTFSAARYGLGGDLVGCGASATAAITVLWFIELGRAARTEHRTSERVTLGP